MWSVPKNFLPKSEVGKVWEKVTLQWRNLIKKPKASLTTTHKWCPEWDPETQKGH